MLTVALAMRRRRKGAPKASGIRHDDDAGDIGGGEKDENEDDDDEEEQKGCVNMLFKHLAVNVASLLSALLPMAFPPESSSTVFAAILHCAVIVVTKMAHMNRAFWDTVVQGTTIRMAEFLHQDWTALDAVFKLATLRVALGPQPDGALDAAVVLAA